MSTTVYCDRCGDPRAHQTHMGHVNLATSQNGYRDRTFLDLCQSCREDLRDLILFWLANNGVSTEAISDWATRDSPTR